MIDVRKSRGGNAGETYGACARRHGHVEIQRPTRTVCGVGDGVLPCRVTAADDVDVVRGGTVAQRRTEGATRVLEVKVDADGTGLGVGRDGYTEAVVDARDADHTPVA